VRPKKYPEPTTDPPNDETIENWIMDVEMPEATDGCTIEPDGTCHHGHPSWLIRLGLI
jgi:hypothetical protein